MQPNQRFIDLRKRLGPSQLEFAEKTGISRSTIADIERGRIGVSKRVKNLIVAKFPQESGYLDAFLTYKNVQKNEGVELGSSQEGGKLGVRKEAKPGVPAQQTLRNIDFVRRLHSDLKKEEPELHSFVVNAFTLTNFQYFIPDFEQNYLIEFWKLMIPSAYPNSPDLKYSDFKNLFVEKMRQYDYLKPHLEKIAGAIVQFYRDFEPLDTKKVIENHFNSAE